MNKKPLTTVDMPEKSIFKSKMFWFNALMIIAAVSSELVTEFPNLGEGSVLIMGVINIILRVVTKKGTYIA
jgi:hypothetical protein